MNKLSLVLFLNLLGVAGLTGCQTVKVNFDTLPDGSAISGDTGHAPIPSDPPRGIDPQYVITDKYSSVGVTFSDPGVHIVRNGNASSLPNEACPVSVNPDSHNKDWSFSDPIVATVKSTSSIATHVTDVYVTIIGDTVTMTAFDPSGNQLGSTSGGGSNQTLHLNYADIGKIQLTGSNYCIDDLKVTDP